MNQPLTDRQAKSLLDEAQAAMAHSVSPWSGFPVGAALLCADGAIVTGCNIESPTLLHEICAERVALIKALSMGRRAFTHLAVTAAKRPAIAPCGVCRQMLMEFAPDLMVIAAGEDGQIRQRELRELLPDPFLKP